jgi:lysocardiolipin and lysophospholipid acyltransferase
LVAHDAELLICREKRPKFEHVLLPRTSGLQIIMDAVKDAKPDIYDLTIAFPSYSGEVPTYDMGYGRKTDTEVPSMKSLLAGKGPESVSIHAQKFAFDDVTGDLQEFLDTRWKEKEARMNYFIEHQCFPEAKDEGVKRLHLSVRC